MSLSLYGCDTKEMGIKINGNNNNKWLTLTDLTLAELTLTDLTLTELTLTDLTLAELTLTELTLLLWL